MKLLLLGGNGQVGHELRRSLAPLGDVVVTTRSGCLPDGSDCEALDLAHADAIDALIQRVAPDVVVNAAAYTAVDRAEDEPELAYRINAQAPGRIADACAAHGATLIHYSTDYVFDGSGTRPYREDDPTAPLGIYGASKLDGEQAVAASGAHYLILRTAWVYGLHGANFLRTMLRLGAEHDELRVVADQIGAPTPAWLIADHTATMLTQASGRNGDSGIWHLTAAGQASWHEFADAIFTHAYALGLLSQRPRVVPITTAEYPTRAARPAYSVLDLSKLSRDFNCHPVSWRDCLEKTLAEAAREPS